MGYFDLIQEFDHEQVVFCSDKESGLRAIIGIHDTTLGPALGGCRMKQYASESEALDDVLRLSRAMTFKSSMAGLNLGGGKTVVMLDDPAQKTPELLRALAQRINALNGTYIGAGDIGSDTRDLKLMREVTPWITGLAKDDGGLGDSAILTSLGVFMGLKAAVKERLGTDDLSGLRITMQGAGKVGSKLIDHLYKAGCQLWVTDVSEEAMFRIKANYPQINLVANLDELFKIEAEVFSPNAVGGVISQSMAEQIPVNIVAGGANNILVDDQAGQVLKERDILYAPDYVINSGGVIMVACEIEGKSFDEARELTEGIYSQALEVFKVAREENVTTQEAAYRLALRRIDAARKKPVKEAESTKKLVSAL